MKVKNLLSRFQKIVEWSLVAKCAVFVFLALFASLRGSIFAWGTFFVISVWFFYSENTERRAYKYSYTLFIVLVFLYGSNIKDSVFGDVIFFVLICALLAVWVGFTRFVFKEKEQIVDMYHCVLIFFIALFALLFPGLLSAMGAGIGIGSIVYEYFLIHKFPWKQRMILASVASGFFVCELLLIAHALPLHEIALAGVVALLVVTIRNLLVGHFSGFLTREFLFQNISIFVLLCIVLFSTGKWVI